MNTPKYPQGSSISLTVGIGGDISTVDWTCYLQITNKNSFNPVSEGRPIVDRNSDNTKFLVNVLPSETQELLPGKYIIGLELSNSTTAQSGEITKEIEIIRQRVTLP